MGIAPTELHTGIVRLLDDLGRVVIPKEIRKRLNWQMGDPLEVYIGFDCVTLRKYNDFRIETALKGIINLLQDSYDLTAKDKEYIYNHVSDMMKYLEVLKRDRSNEIN